ncbi:MAG TPA: amino acid adenylation domain-containing protein [Pyrinomonadaceae bacterium]|jgi:natural product biosynthesis luciferase-like monooxygenase protein/amino acid adenylation domain-containing protein/FkbM family methyltransferase
MRNIDIDAAELSAEKRELLEMLAEEESGGADSFPLSFAQQRLWFLSRLEPDSPFYNIATAVRLKGQLNVSALEAALNEIVRRHESLRTIFAMEGDEPVQVVLPSLALAVPVDDLKGLAAGAQIEAEVKRRYEEEAQRPFDLSAGPLLRVRLLRLSESEHVAVLVLHHIISDGWSMGVLVREVAALYAAFAGGQQSPLEELPIQYADFAVWQREWMTGEVLEQQVGYWKTQLAGANTALELPTDHQRPARQSARGAELLFTLPSELTAALKSLGGDEGATMFMTLVAAFQVLLNRYTNQGDLLVGTPIANRNQPEIEGLIGFFVNTLVLRADLSDDPTFRQLLARVRETTLDAYAHQDLPFEKLVEELQPERSLSRNPLFQVMFALQNAPVGALKLPGLTLNLEEFDSGFTRFDLELHMREQGDELRGTLIYSTDLFEETTMHRFVGHFRTLLEGIVNHPEERVSMLPLLGEMEAEQIVEEWNGETVDFSRDLCIHQLFERQAEATPDNVSVEFTGQQLSYRELNRRANQLAHYLVRRGVGADVPVGIMMERSVEMAVAVLGVLKAGGCYLPLDPAYPQERLSVMLEDSRAPVLLTQPDCPNSLSTGYAGEVVYLDARWEALSSESDENPRTKATPQSLAYLIYTSGSTGRPKGVAMPHRPLVNLIEWQIARSGKSRAPRTLQFTSLSFDVSFQEIFSTWLCGATLVLVSEEVRRDSRELLRVLSEQRIERLFQPFIALQYLAEMSEEEGIVASSLREVITAGEQLKVTRHVRSFFTKLAGCTLDNQYGPTETHVVSAYMLEGAATDWPELPPIGRPVPNVQLYVLDERMQVVPVGVPGELYVGGEALARGYLRRAEATSEKFIPHPFKADGEARLYRTGDIVRYLPDGQIEFLGRRDHQVKIRGYRIEIAEVEAAISQHERVREALVVAREGAAGEKRLVAYVLPSGEATSGELRDYLKAKLPEYMIPSAFVMVDAWPLTPSGKVDRKALPAPSRDEAEGAFVEPRTPTEEQLAGIWGRLLGVERVGALDNFFELGGHSLLATQLMSRVREGFGVDLPLRSLFEEPTVEGFARLIERETGGRATEARQAPPLVPMLREGNLPLSFGQQRLWFIDQLGMGGTAYSLAGAIRLRGELDAEALERSIGEVVRRHESLRTTFEVVDGEPVQVVHPFSGLELPRVDLSHLPEAERESEVKRLFDEEAQSVFNLEAGPLVRMSLLRRAATDHVLILNMHHIISDGWSIRVLVREVATLYEAFVKNLPSPLPELHVQYGDYAVWQRRWLQGEVLDAQVAYWKQKLQNALPVLELPTDRPRPAVQSSHGARQTVSIPPRLEEKLRSLAQREGVTLYMLLLAAFQTLLHRYTGEEDIIVGSPVAGRQEIETENLIGLFINMVVMRAQVNAHQSFRELLEQVRRTALEAYAHQDVPFERLVDELHPERDLSHSPIFQVMFVLHNAVRKAFELPGLIMEPLEGAGSTARYDLTLELSERDAGLEGWFEYNTDIFDAETIERMGDHLLTLLEAVATQPEQQLDLLPLLTERERRRMLVEWNDTGRDYARDKAIHEFFEQQAARTPERTALVFEESEISYGNLNRRANQLAHHLLALGVGRGTRIGIFVERSIEMMVGLLGVLKAGGAYVPLDPAYPHERLAFMLNDADVSALLTQERLLGQLPSNQTQIVRIDTDWHTIAQQRDTNPNIQVEPEHLAYVIYTSGSTGKPKGVCVAHKNVSNFFSAMDERIGVSSGTEQTTSAASLPDSSSIPTWLALTSISFDISVLELFWSLARGFQLIIQPERDSALRLSSLQPRLPSSDRTIDFSLFYFASSEEAEPGSDKYRLLIEGARFADSHSFSAVWTPERHFHAFGGLYPNPSVISAALAMVTHHINIRAGSVVLPLHHPIRVAEEWSIVDNLSGGRVGVSFASGWHANDFVFRPENYAERQRVMYEGIEQVRSLWRGEGIKLRDGAGSEVEVKILPHPVQKELPIWVTAAGSIETFRSAGRIGAGLLTHLLGQSVEELGEKVEAYREAWREAGHGKEEGSRWPEGHVTLMLHTYVGEEKEAVREIVRKPFNRYLMQSVGLARNLTRSLGYDLEIESLSEDELEAILNRGFDRYFETSGLLGTPDSCMEMIERLKAIGVDEVGCLIDFGIETETVLRGLRYLNIVRERSNRKQEADAGEADYSVPAQIARYGVTHLQCTPSMARMLLLDPRGASALASVKKLLLGGEELHASFAAELGQIVTGEIHNMYGPTETTIWSTTHQVSQAGGAVPIGRPIANTEIYILDRQLQPVPVGVRGELFIGGEGVVPGYLKRPDLTSDRFIPNAFGAKPGARIYRTGDAASYLPDGTIQFWGRTDNQVKLRGYRIELGEIEAQLEEHPSVREAAVAARTDDTGEQRLVAYVVPAQAEASDLQTLALSPEAETILGERPRFTLPNGMVVAHHTSPQTSAIYREIFEDRVYDRHGLAFNDGDCIFDVGSNIGLFTLFANLKCKRPRVFAFEPIPPTFDLLRTNVSLYDLDVKLFNVGVADKVDVASFTFYREAAGLSGRSIYAANDKEITKTIISNWFTNVGSPDELEPQERARFDELMEEVMHAETYDCRLTTLSNVIREHEVERIDLLKVDVEGGELDVLNGIEEEHWGRIRQVVMEIDTKEMLDEIKHKLEKRGFRVNVDETTTVHAGTEYFYTIYASRLPQNGSSNGAGRRATTASAPVFSSAELRNYLKEKLPEYMVPATFMTLEALPLTPNGKVNRKALPAPEANRQAAGVAYEAPQTEAEQTISAIWQEALRVDRVGLNDNFFDLGGNSLLLVKVHSKLQEAFGKNISMVEMFRRATVGSLASYLVGEQTGKSKLKQAQSRAQKQTEAMNTQRQQSKARAQRFTKDRKR